MNSRKINGFNLTDEQNQIVDTICLSKESLLVNAYAGASKSSTSSAVCKEYKGNILYTTFGSKNVAEAKKSFGDYANCVTNYGLAFRSVGKQYLDKGRLPEIFPIEQISEFLKLKTFSIDGFQFTKNNQAHDILKTIIKYCYSTDEEINLNHFYSDIFKDNSEYQSIASRYGNKIVKYSRQLKEHMFSIKSNFPITHDIYVKIWALSKPDLSNYDLIIGDEFQDVNPVFYQVIKDQPCQKLIVGDQYQSIFEWRGAVDAMGMMGIDKKLYLSKSFRFGNNVADLSKLIIKDQLGENICIKGFENINTVIDYSPTVYNNFTVLCRTNAVCLRYLIEVYKVNKKVKFIGETTKMIRYIYDIMALRSKRQAKGSLSIFKTYKDLVEYTKTPMGGEIKTLISIIDNARKNEIDIKHLIDIFRNSSVTRKPDIIITTSHSSKGLEFNNVMLANDFKRPGDDNWEKQDGHLLYTACTRVKQNLDVSRCSAITSILK